MGFWGVAKNKEEYPPKTDKFDLIVFSSIPISEIERRKEMSLENFNRDDIPNPDLECRIKWTARWPVKSGNHSAYAYPMIGSKIFSKAKLPNLFQETKNIKSKMHGEAIRNNAHSQAIMRKSALQAWRLV